MSRIPKEIAIQRGISPDDWADWRWHMRNRIKTVEQLKSWINVAPEEVEAIARTGKRYAWTITPYFASLMDPDDPHCPVRLQAIPNNAETQSHSLSSIDPVDDMGNRVTNRVIHKYPDRAVFLVTSICPVLCRYCTRKHHTTALDSTYFAGGEGDSMEEDFAYIRNTPAIRDVLLTGGDPLSYSDSKLERIIAALRSIPHVEIVRIGSRYPVLLPQRITPELCSMLERYHPIWLNTHFNHPNELTAEATAACNLLLKHGIPVGNQSVLLKGINDNIATMTELCRKLVGTRVRPYYLYHCDSVEGVSHFQTSVAAGREIMKGLWGMTTGFSIPQYIVTTSAGKISLAEDHVLGEGEARGTIRLRAYTGETVEVFAEDGLSAPDL